MAAFLPQATTKPEEKVTCPICLQHYSDPRLLPCLHTYCRQCLEDLLAKGQRKNAVVCPECREEVQIIFGDVTKLKVNFWINNLLSLLAIHSTEEKDGGKTELTCENCDMKETATRRCTNCCMFLCDFCSTAHQRSVATKGHQLMTMNQIKDTVIPIIEKQLYCAKHKGEVKKLFCNTCKDLICRDCTIIDHRDHQFNFVEDVADQHKQLFKTEVERASIIKNKIEAVLKSVQEMKKNVEKTSKTTKKRVDDFIDEQIKALEAKRITLKKESQKIAATKMKDLVAQEDGLTMHLTGLKSAIEFTEKVLTNGGNSDVLSVSKEVTSRLSQLCEKQINEKPRAQDSMGIRSDEQIFRDWIEQRVDVVDTSVPDPKQCLVTQSINGRFVPNNGPNTATHGQVLTFVICVSNEFGEKLRFMEDRIEVMVCYTPFTPVTSFGTGLFGTPSVTGAGSFFNASAQPPQTSAFKVGCAPSQPRSNTITTQIQDLNCHEDNTYSFDFCFDQGMSQADIIVTVDGIQIQGCPFRITYGTSITKPCGFTFAAKKFE